MARSPRLDLPGSWHHVMNRGIARRTMFEGTVDVRFFLSRLAREVHRGRLEVHAYVVMTTHFHLLARSLLGKLSEAMRVLQNEYVRRFNRRHRRDGTLIRGRFVSRPVLSLEYRRTLVTYIDENPVRAGLVDRAGEYPFGSARSYWGGRTPPWLERSWIDRDVEDRSGSPWNGTEAYARTFGRPLVEGARKFIERRSRTSHSGDDPLDHLVAAAPREVRDWMRRKALLADGTDAGLPVVDPDELMRVVDEAARRQGQWEVRPSNKASNGWQLLGVGLLRDLAGLTYPEIAARVGCDPSNASRRYGKHVDLLGCDPDYAIRAGELARDALRVCFGPRS